MKLAMPLLAISSLVLSSASALATSPKIAQPDLEQEQVQRDSPDLERPLQWLLAAQNEDGSWGAELRSQSPDVATTAIAGIALLRMSHAGSQGELQARARRAVDYVVSAVRRAPADQIAVQEPGTLPQRKLGRNVDTYLAAQFLAEALPTLPRAERGPAEAALADCVRRIERAQGPDGSFSKDGWAPLLSSAFAASGLHAAALAGAKVDEKKLARADANLMGKYDDRTKTFDNRESAGVDLYSAAASVVAAARVQAAPPASPEGARDMKVKAEAVTKGVGGQLSSERLMRGFGSYGGEEHVSYMMTAEAKAAVGGSAFAEWNKEMRRRLAQIQREDGTWRGDHCITSTTFCTAASLVTLVTRPHAGGRPA
jgi:Prenyltransferase and squalene oxidase repeat